MIMSQQQSEFLKTRLLQPLKDKLNHCIFLELVLRLKTYNPCVYVYTTL